ncbi:MAG: hypothetical protein IKV45_02420 [Firmicutes bacterium]|nr:hypothetical protein [Bacillota bacterium]
MTTTKKLQRILSILLIIALLCLCAAAVKKIIEHWHDDHIDTNAVFFTALTDMQNWQSYRYVLDAELTLNNYKKAKTVLQGEQDTQGNLHMFGEIMDTEMEAYQFDNDHYRFNSSSKEWKHLAESPLTDNGVLRMVIEPTLNFCFNDTISVDYKGPIHEEGKKYYRFIVVPKEGFHIADTYFTDFKYRIDISAETMQITAAVISGVSRTKSENKITLQIRFYDINKEFLLRRPS